MLPIIANKRPYLLDPFMLRLMIRNNSSIRSSIFDSIDHKEFSAIIFAGDPLKKIHWCFQFPFGYDFIIKIIDNYKVGIKKDKYMVYAPK